MITTVFLLMVGAAVLAPQHLPKASRILGRFTGRSVRFLHELKESFSKTTASDSEMMKMKKDFDSLMGELYSVRSDIRQGFNIRRYSSYSDFNTGTNIATTSNTASSANTATAAATGSIDHVTTASVVQSNIIKEQNVMNNSSGRGSHFAMAFASMQSVSTFIEQQQQQPQQQYEQKIFEQSISENRKNNENNNNIVEEMEKFKKVSIDLKQSPFAAVNFSAQSLRGLQEDGSSNIRTENLGGGADLISKSILEKNFAIYSQMHGLNEKELLSKMVDPDSK
jgi:Sec-independent protein translocase protein TatA